MRSNGGAWQRNATAYRPPSLPAGNEALAAFPAGPASLELGLFGVAALLAGGLLGLPGHRRGREQLAAAAVSGLLALLVFLGIVFFLPDTRRPDLLLAVAAATLLATARALVRASVRRRQAPLSP